jgi:hypothetical protein
LRTNQRLIAASERRGNNGFRMPPRVKSYGIRRRLRRRGGPGSMAVNVDLARKEF